MIPPVLGLKSAKPGLNAFYRVGGAALLLAVVVALAEIAIHLLPGVAQATQRTFTVIDWFTLFHDNAPLGLRNLGLLNLVGVAFLAPAYLAMYFAVRHEKEPWAAMGAILFFTGMAVYLANNRAFDMMSLSSQYFAAGSSSQQAALVAAGEAILVEGSNRIGICFIDLAGVVMSAAMLRSKVFGKPIGLAGVVGNSLMIVFEIILAFAPAWIGAGYIVAMGGGISIIVWYLLVDRWLLLQGSAPTAG